MANFFGINSLYLYHNNVNEFLFIKNINTIHFSNLENLKVLFLKNTKYLLLNDCKDLCKIIHNNTILKMDILNINYDININSFTNLTSLSIIDCNFLNNNILKKISNKLINLKSLILNYSKNFTDISCLNNIKTLELVGCSQIRHGYNNLLFNEYLDISYNNLQSFKPKNNKHIKINYSPIKIFNFKNLLTLELIGNKNISYEDTKLFENIRYLNLSETRIKKIHPIKNLNELHLSFCSFIKEIPYIKNLKILNIANSNNIIKLESSNLELLNITNCNKIKNIDNIKAKKLINFI